MVNLPSGTVTFLLTDIEGSTRLWELRTAAMDHALQRHNAILLEAFTGQGGHVVTGRGEGDSVFAVFPSARQALVGAIEAQIKLQQEPWPEGVQMSVRMAMHTGEAELRDGEYHGHAAINRCGRLRNLAHGGQVLMSATTRDLLYHHLPEGTRLKSLGEHKLRDIEVPERIFQVVHDNLREDFPPISTAPQAASNLPEQLTSFVGRERESAELKTLLERSRLVTLTGSAGAGKTRMAIKVAGELLDAYEDGVCMVELASLADSDLVPQAVATALNLRPPAEVKPETYLVETLRDQRRLLLLDNCEHLIAACARLTEALLKGCPRIRVLATSREALGVPGEVSWRMPSLVPSEAAKLFEERASLALPGFRLEGKLHATLEALCQRLDGIPLAIELAAPRVRVMPPEEILKRLEHRFRLLTGGSRTA
ncbi:MAG TPA: NB-ARC domain-containing protein, partial [Patescibacteria group bacterium]|nr:NB-ARC domain-containing protein [Patescibacteria group bacterium]